MKHKHVIASDPKGTANARRRERSNLTRLLRRLRLLAMTGSILVLAGLPRGFAYTDEVRAEREEVWRAAWKVFEAFGIKKADEKKGVLESRWIEDEVRRRNKLLKGVTSQVYRRRYRMKVSLAELQEDIQVDIKGNFEEKPRQSSQGAPWRKFKPQMQEYDLERNYFMLLLSQLAKDRSQPA